MRARDLHDSCLRGLNFVHLIGAKFELASNNEMWAIFKAGSGSTSSKYKMPRGNIIPQDRNLLRASSVYNGYIVYPHQAHAQHGHTHEPPRPGIEAQERLSLRIQRHGCGKSISRKWSLRFSVGGPKPSLVEYQISHRGIEATDEPNASILFQDRKKA